MLARNYTQSARCFRYLILAFFGTIAGFFASIVPLFAQSDNSGMIAPVGKLDEELLDAAEVGGTIFVGLRFLGEQAENKTLLSALVPKSWAGQVMCAHLNSADGLYSASQKYRIGEAWVGGFDDLEFTTKHAKDLATYDQSEMAVRISRDECDPESELAGLAGWNLLPDTESKAELVVNSFRSDEVYLVIKPTGEEIDCEIVREGARTSFDAICPLEMTWAASGEELQLDINRIRRGEFEPPVSVILQGNSF